MEDTQDWIGEEEEPKKTVRGLRGRRLREVGGPGLSSAGPALGRVPSTD